LSNPRPSCSGHARCDHGHRGRRSGGPTTRNGHHHAPGWRACRRRRPL